MADVSNTDSTEIWKPIPDMDGYEASSIGRIRSVDRYVKHSCGSGKVLRRGQILKIKIEKFGYARVPINCASTGKGKMIKTVHSLVCAAFIGPRPDGLHINHINNVRHDNRIVNLEYVTPRQNCQHRKVHGTYPIGVNNGRSKLTEADVLEIRRKIEDGVSQYSLSKHYGVTQTQVSWIKLRKSWTHI
jgi:HNH endonuclease/NUMOD4 motif